MTGRKRKFIALTSLAVGICVFTAAAVANLATADGYMIYKNALFGAMQGIENYTLKTDLTILIDGVEAERREAYEMFSATGDANLYYESNCYSAGEHDRVNITYMQDGLKIELAGDEIGALKARVYEYFIPEEGAKYYAIPGGSYSPEVTSSFGTTPNMDRESRQRELRFMELLADTLVGDLKNNFVYVSGDENSKKYAITLDGMQVPELVNAGISLAFSSTYGNYYDNEPLSMLGNEPIVCSASMEFIVDNEGRLMHNAFSMELVGQDESDITHTMDVSCAFDLFDYGTTIPKKADLDSLDIEYWVKDGERIDIPEYAKTQETAEDVTDVK